jgi:predicted transcriptional regulator
MGRPPSKELTDRELEVMHVFWSAGELTAAEARDQLAATGLHRSYTTIANLVRGLSEKGCLRQLNAERPFVYRAARSYEEISGRLLSDLVHRVFRGSRAQLLCRLVQHRKLSADERSAVERILREAAR